MGLCGSCMRIPTGNQKKQRCRSEMCSSHAGALRPACASLARMLSTPAEEMISLREAIEDVINDGGPPLAGPYGTGRAEVGSNRSCTKRSHSKKRQLQEQTESDSPLDTCRKLFYCCVERSADVVDGVTRP